VTNASVARARIAFIICFLVGNRKEHGERYC
jgi:hypothetical protein